MLVTVDLDATNGTWVNGERVDRRRLRPCDDIELGNSTTTLAVTGDQRLS